MSADKCDHGNDIRNQCDECVAEDRAQQDAVDAKRAAEPMLRHFVFDHLKHETMRAMSARFHHLALTLVDTLPASAERTVALRKLLEGKDCAVRAVLDVEREKK